ncbi:U2 small nuclear ribonucleoprotein A [Alternaria alternata]|nr:U2 small nuclear ribonucleoprotein A [Alternaria alternata]
MGAARVSRPSHPTCISMLTGSQDNDAIDLTDNDIAQLGNFPLQPRLRTLFLAQNRISNIQPNLSSSIPNLRTLVLTKNKIAELADLDPLAGFKHLVYLSLMGNPVTRKEVDSTARDCAKPHAYRGTRRRTTIVRHIKVWFAPRAALKERMRSGISTGRPGDSTTDMEAYVVKRSSWK